MFDTTKIDPMKIGKAVFKNLLYISFNSLICPVLIILSIIFRSRKKKKVIFGTTPIINNKYWCQSLKEIGIEAETLMSGYYKINQKEDFDLYFEDFFPGILRKRVLLYLFAPILVWIYILKNAKIIVTTFEGIAFKKFFWRLEPILARVANIKMIVIPYGADGYMYSRIKDPSLQQVLLASYPEFARKERDITNKVFYLSKYADVVITGVMTCEGFPRWDACVYQPIIIDTKKWQPKKEYSACNGKNGPVRILHAPNHRAFKGTEFILKVAKELKQEGYDIDLVLLENVPNEKIRETMQEVDILVEQLIATGYAMNGIEGMACGLPVLSNLENSLYTTIFKRYSYLQECPILSTTPESLKDNLKLLIENPDKRRSLGEKGRIYVEKYHSYSTFQYLFETIIRRLNGESVDLMFLFSTYDLRQEAGEKVQISDNLSTSDKQKR